MRWQKYYKYSEDELKQDLYYFCIMTGCCGGEYKDKHPHNHNY
jgi:hypothetical protein